MANTLSQAELGPKELHLETPALSRGVDLIASSLGLLVLAPIFLIIGLVIKLTSAGPVFHRAERVGQGGRLFRLYKFRSMYLEADRLGPGITVRDDPRITPIGRFLRRTKLDELPQLLNVFLGQMSLVGPRPEDPRYVALYSPEQCLVLTAKPGITSPASLFYRDEERLLKDADWETIYQHDILPHKLALDLAYLQQRSLRNDLVLILHTIASIIGQNSSARQTRSIQNGSE